MSDTRKLPTKIGHPTMQPTRNILLILLCPGIMLGQVDWVLLNPTPALVAASPQKGTTHAIQPATTNQFRRIEKPLEIKIAVTLGGFTLIGLELWWFLGSNRRMD